MTISRMKTPALWAGIALIAAGSVSAVADTNRLCADGEVDNCYVTGNFPPDIAQQFGITDETSLVLRFVQGTWYMGDNLIGTFGGTGWTPVVGDWDGDGYDNIGIYKNGAWWLKHSYDLSLVWIDLQTLAYGDSSYTPMTGDWNNDGVDMPGLYKNGAFDMLHDYTDLTDETTIRFGSLPYNPDDANAPHPIIGSFGNQGDRAGIADKSIAELAPAGTGNANMMFNTPNNGTQQGTVPTEASGLFPIVVDGFDPNNPTQVGPRLMYSKKPTAGHYGACPLTASPESNHCNWLITDSDDRPNDSGRTVDPDPEIF
ncbi:MAG: hypothetical protein AAF465_11870 [Pseudomonadota bacterium]